MSDTYFDGTDLSIYEIREEVRRREWPGARINVKEFLRTDKLLVRRISKRAAYGPLETTAGI